MRVSNVGQENNVKTSSVLKAGAMGALGGAVVRNLAPLTTEEHDFFFNSSTVEAVKTKTKNVRLNEIQKIKGEFLNGNSGISKDVFDTFEKHKSVIADEPKKIGDYIKDYAENVQTGVKALAKRVDLVGAAKEHVEVANIKSAAKASRPLAFFAFTGALVAMSGQVIANALKSPEDKKAKENKEKENLSMADVLLEGLGGSTEILFLTNEKLTK